MMYPSVRSSTRGLCGTGHDTGVLSRNVPCTRFVSSLRPETYSLTEFFLLPMVVSSADALTPDLGHWTSFILVGQCVGHPTDTVERYGDLWEGGLVLQRMHWGTEQYVVTVYRPMTSVLTYNTY